MTDARKPLGRPPVYGERKKILLALPVELFAKLETYRAEKGLTLTAAIQQIIERALRKR
jgi:hypothetical protein